MPVTKRDGKYYWGSKGPFDSRKEAQAVQRAAFASGYEKMVGNPVGASDEGVKPNTAQDVADREKLLIYHDVWQNSTGASNIPDRTETVAKWANTSDQITSIQLLNDKAGDFASGSFIRIWGAD